MLLPAYLAGLDLGQAHDPTALAIAEWALVTRGEVAQYEYNCRHLERFPLGMAYPDMVELVTDRLRRLPRPAAWQAALTRQMERAPSVVAQQQLGRVMPYRLILDATGVGRPIADLFARVIAAPIRVTMTAGQVQTNPTVHEFHVPKRALVGAFQVALQTRRFRVARQLSEAARLIQEGQNFQWKIHAATGHDTYGAWREGTHDDLLFAAALIAWYGEYVAPRPGQRPPPRPRFMGQPSLFLKPSRTGV